MHVCNILDICHGDSCGTCITVFNVFAGLDLASILLGVAVYLFSTSVSSVFIVLYIFSVFSTSFTLPFGEVGLALDLVD